MQKGPLFGLKAHKMERDKMLKNFLDSIVFSDEPGDITDILTIIENPFLNKRGVDVPSLIFHRFYRNTEVPIALPLFSFYSILSAWCVLNKATYKVPLAGDRPYELDTWVMALAPSGAAKTLSIGEVLKMVPMNPETAKQIIEPNFQGANGPAAFVQQLDELPDGRGFWYQDEASQMFKLIEQIGHPMAEIKEFLLKMKDHKEITRITKDEKLVTKPIVMTQFFINTIDSMARAVSDESMKDGTLRRYQFAIAQKDDRNFTDFSLYELQNLSDDILVDEMLSVFSQNISSKSYEFDDDSKVMYQRMFKVFWEKQYSKFMSGSENIYRTHMMEAFKYAIFHHIIHKKEGSLIGGESMQHGLKIVMFLLNSLQSFIKYRLNATPEDITERRTLIENVQKFISEQDGKPGFGLRSVYRKFNIKKDDVMQMLKAIKKHDPKFKTSLYEKIK